MALFDIIPPEGFEHGTTPTYTITPAAGSHIEDVLVDGQSVGKVTSYTFAPLEGAQTIQAVFATNTGWMISVRTTGDGTVSPGVDTSVLEGASRKFTFAPAAGSKIGSLIVDGVSKVVQSSWTFSNVTSDHTLEVNFVPDVLTVTASAGSNGSISPAGAVNVPRYGSQTFTFSPNEGYKVNYFTVNGINRGSDDSYTLSNVKMNQTINVYFTKKTYTITASATAGGTISYVGDKVFEHGTTPTYTIKPAAGSHIEDVLVDGQSVGKVTSYTFATINAPHTISASFVTNP